jgi:cellulose biosynthesis protein BcsQ
MSTIEMITVIGSVLAIIGGLFTAIIWLLRNHSHLDRLKKKEEDSQKDIARLKEDLETAHKQLKELQSTDSKTGSRLQIAFPQIFRGGDPVQELRSSMEAVRKFSTEKFNAIQNTSRQKDQTIEKLSERNDKLEEHLRVEEKNLNSLKEELTEKENRLGELTARIEKVAKLDSRLWLQPVDLNSVQFRLLSQRKRPIISVVNFKGGVGKTTITANLAATWGQLGKKVLMIDLDYQRSLSLMFVPSEKRSKLHNQKRCLQHYLSKNEHSASSLDQCIESLSSPARNCSIIINSDPSSSTNLFDGLEDIESNLLVNWLLPRPSNDIRLLLRKGLHEGLTDNGILKDFDYVLLDCPPRLTTACINALAASDMILIPVILDELSAPSIDHLLKSLKRLRPTLLSNIQMIGIVSNKVKFLSENLIQAHQTIWDKLPAGKTKIWGDEVVVFDSKIPISHEIAKIGSSLDDVDDPILELAIKFKPIREAFSTLASELDSHIEKVKKHESIHPTAISS